MSIGPSVLHKVNTDITEKPEYYKNNEKNECIWEPASLNIYQNVIWFGCMPMIQRLSDFAFKCTQSLSYMHSC